MDKNGTFSDRGNALKKLKRSCIVTSIVELILVLIMIVISALFNDAISGTFWGVLCSIVLIVCAYGIIFAPFNYASERKKIGKIFCPYCGTKYDYDMNVGCDLVNVRNSKMLESQFALVEFRCECDNCGKETSFRKRYKTAEIDTFGNLKIEGVERKMRKYFDFNI